MLEGVGDLGGALWFPLLLMERYHTCEEGEWEMRVGFCFNLFHSFSSAVFVVALPGCLPVVPLEKKALLKRHPRAQGKPEENL